MSAARMAAQSSYNSVMMSRPEISLANSNHLDPAIMTINSAVPYYQNGIALTIIRSSPCLGDVGLTFLSAASFADSCPALGFEPDTPLADA